METYISLLRGINVGGKKPIKMKLLKGVFENIGFKNVRTYIQSGNVIFQSKETKNKKLEMIISEGLFKSFGFEVPLVILKKNELEIISENNIFILNRNEDISKLAVTFLSSEPDNQIIKSIEKNKFLPDEFFFAVKWIYLFCPNGFGSTKLNNSFFENKCKVIATTRNWKTILELSKICGN
jgi:uncharacterized protein (DUF1697 family)